MNIMKDPGFNWAYLYGLSDFWVTMFSDPELFGGLYNATTIQMAKSYSKFLGLTSGISLEQVQVNSSSETELVIITVPFGSEDETTFALDKHITSCEFLTDRPILPNVTLESGVDFDLNQRNFETWEVTFSKPLSEFGFPYRETDGGVEYALWASDCTLDEGFIYSQYAKTIRIDPDISTNIYKDYIRGLYFLFSQGPNLSYMEQGINLALGVPVARSDEVVFLQNFDPQQGTWIVVTDKNSYVLPYGIVPTVSRGDILKAGDSLASVVEIQDFTTSGDWWLDIYIPQSVFPANASGSVASAGSVTYDLMANYLKTHTFLVKIELTPGVATGNFETLKQVIDKVKPSFTLAIYTWAIDFGTEELDSDDDTMSVTPTVIKDDFLGYPNFMDRAKLTVYPDTSPKTTRGTNKWLIRGNYSTDYRNTFNTPLSAKVVAPFHIKTTDYLGTVGPEIGNTTPSFTSQYDVFSGDGATPYFYLKYSPVSMYSVNLYVNGVYQDRSKYYIYDNVLNILTAPATGTNNVEVVYLAAANLVVNSIQLSGDGVSTTYSIPFTILDENQLAIYISGVFVNHVKYSVSGRSVTFLTAPASGTNNIEINIFDTVDNSVPGIYVFSGNGSTTSFNTGRENLRGVDLQAYVNGVYQNKTAYTVNEGIVTFPTAPSSGTNNIEIVQTQDIAPQGMVLYSRKDTYSGNGSRTVFDLQYNPVDDYAMQVFVGGVRQTPQAYTVTGPLNGTLTFVTAPPAESMNVEIVYLSGEGVTYNYTLFSGNGSTTAFTTNFTITDQFGISVYVGGVYQTRDKYSISGNVVTFVTAPVTGTSNIEVVSITSPNYSTNVSYFATDGTTTVFNTGITGVSPQYVDVYYRGVYQNVGTYNYANGVITMFQAPTADTRGLEVVTTNYTAPTFGIVSATPIYNAKEAEIRSKLAAANVTVPTTLPVRFAIYGYTQTAVLDSRAGIPGGVLQGQSYYSPVSDTHTDNLLEVDANGFMPETHRSYYYSNANTGIMLFQKCGDNVDLWTVFVVGTQEQPIYYQLPDEDPLTVALVPV